jgi:hypothetical protein
MEMPGRSYSSPSYRFGYMGYEKDDEIKGISGADYDFNGYGYDSRLGRRKGLDPFKSKYSSWSPYVFAQNNPIFLIDKNGQEVFKTTDFSNSLKAEAGLALLTQTNIGKTFLSQFASINQMPGAGQLNVNLGVTDNGILSRHNVVFGVKTQEQGETGFQIKNSDGTFVDYKGQDFGAEAQFQITIDVKTFPGDKAGNVAYALSHESFVHSENIAKVLSKFEEAKKAADGDPTKVAAAVTQLKEDLKPFTPGTKEFEAQQTNEHKTVATGTDKNLQQAVKELKAAVSGKPKEEKAIENTRELDVQIQKEDTK